METVGGDSVLTNMTPTERERLAYAEGFKEAAALLAQLADLQFQLEDAQIDRDLYLEALEAIYEGRQQGRTDYRRVHGHRWKGYPMNHADPHVLFVIHTVIAALLARYIGLVAVAAYVCSSLLWRYIA